MATNSSSNIVLKKMNSANVRLDNSGDSDRIYDVAANADVSSGYVNSFNGEVMKDGVQIANFASNGTTDESLTVNYQGVAASQQCAVLTAVQEFLAASRSFVSANPSLASL